MKVLFFFIILGNSMLSFSIGNYIHLRFGVLHSYNLIPFFRNILTRLGIITPQEFKNLEDAKNTNSSGYGSSRKN